jgi:hypothetical protein
VSHRVEVREFETEDLAGGFDFIDSLAAFNRIYVEVWEEDRWVCVYGDERKFVRYLLSLVVRERRFRLSGTDPTAAPERPSSPLSRPDLPPLSDP